MLGTIAPALPRFFPHYYNAGPGEVFGSCWVTRRPLVVVRSSNGNGETVVSAVAGWEVAMGTDGMARAVSVAKTPGKTTRAAGAKCDQRRSLRPGATISAEERWNMIAEAAYRRAATREFVDCNLVEDWTRAEADIDARLSETKVKVVS